MLISIISTSYNHENYISKAMDSWLNQIVDCDYEIVIGDDRSTDRSVDIIKEYQQKYPNKITLIENHENIGHVKNLYNVMKIAKGDFFALCAGDDYWIDNQKLQKQLDIALKNKEYKVIFSNAKYLYDFEESNTTLLDYKKNFSFTLYEYLNQKYHTIAGTAFFQRIDLETISKVNFFECVLEDEYLFSFAIKNGGEIYYMSEPMGVYRVHSGGINSQKPLVRLLYHKLKTLDSLKGEFKKDKTVIKLINKVISERIEKQLHYTFDGFDNIPKSEFFKLLVKYRPISFLDYRLYYNWYLKKYIK